MPVVVDNGSDPESVERLKRECGRIFGKILFLKESELRTPGDSRRPEFGECLGEDSMVFIENGENLGFAKGNNVGIRFAELVGAEWVMLLNNDTVVAPGAFQELQSFLLRHPSFAAITPQIRYYDANMRIQNCGGDLTYFGSRKYKFADKDACALPVSDYSVITFVTGCALLFKFKTTGTLSEDFFFGEEDYELSLRMKKLGLTMACVHGAIVHHKLASTIHRESKPFGSILVQYVSRLVNTRNYYSKARWLATKILAYLYLPILLGRNGIDPRKSISIIRCAETHLRGHRDVSRADYEPMITRDS